MVSPTAALRVRYVVCGSWDPLALLGPVLGPWVCFDDLGFDWISFLPMHNV